MILQLSMHLQTHYVIDINYVQILWANHLSIKGFKKKNKTVLLQIKKEVAHFPRMWAGKFLNEGNFEKPIHKMCCPGQDAELYKKSQSMCQKDFRKPYLNS